MIRISGSISYGSDSYFSNVDNHIVDTNRMDFNNITPGSYYACKYDNDLYFCIYNQVSMEHGDVNVKLIHPKATAKNFCWPDREDVCWICLNHMICRFNSPSSGSAT